MSSKNKMITLRCDCRCCMLVIDKDIWEWDGPDGKKQETNYNIAIMDSRYDHNHNTLWGRIKRACSALFGKPVYFNDVYISDPAVFRKLIEDMQELEKSDCTGR